MIEEELRRYVNAETNIINNVLKTWLQEIRFAIPIAWNHDKDNYCQINLIIILEC